MLKNILFFLIGAVVAYFGYSTIKTLISKYMPSKPVQGAKTQAEAQAEIDNFSLVTKK